MKIMICGSGTMGRGIALVSILSGHSAILFDKNQEALNQAKSFIDGQLKKSLDKGSIKNEQYEEYSKRCIFTGELSEQVSQADIVIEAIIESLEIKEDLFSSIEDSNLREDAILATNTSSLSVNVLSKKRKYPHNFIGLHFFNPAHIMKLVEIIKTPMTKEEVLNVALEFCRSINKVPVIAKDVPGFIVNRVARNYYNEAMRIATEHASNPQQIDTLMKSLGFKMGPFELMDLIGNDVNLEVTKSVAAQYFSEPRFTPSLMQQDIVNAGRYGRKSGAGFYDYE